MSSCLVLLLVSLFLLKAVLSSVALDDLVVPAGFKAQIYAEVVTPRTLRSIFYNGATIVYVGTKFDDLPRVYALIDRNNDGTIYFF